MVDERIPRLTARLTSRVENPYTVSARQRKADERAQSADVGGISQPHLSPGCDSDPVLLHTSLGFGVGGYGFTPNRSWNLRQQQPVGLPSSVPLYIEPRRLDAASFEREFAEGFYGLDDSTSSSLPSGTELDEDDDDEDQSEFDETDEGEVDMISPVRSNVVAPSKGRFRRPSQSSTSHRGVKREREDLSWFLTDGVAGGPLICDVIPSFGGHVAYGLWTDPASDRGLLSLQSHTVGLCYLNTWKLSAEADALVIQSGLRHLPSCMFKHLDVSLLTAFVERWQPDTNTFHLPFGEMTILLHDVELILGIPIEGRACGVTDRDCKNSLYSAIDFFRKDENALMTPFDEGWKAPYYKSDGALVEAIYKHVSERNDVATQARGYLMVLLGYTLFVDKSDDKVRANLFPMVHELNRVCTYAWGAGTLAYLYRQLGIASRAGCKQLTGCLSLLQAWIYEHFQMFRPTTLGRDADILSCGPRAQCWHNPKIESSTERLLMYRRALDTMTPEMVNWVPYMPQPSTNHPRTLFSGFLRFVEIVEPYHPDRCLRQLGRVQVIPGSMPTPEDAYRPKKAISYTLEYGKSADNLWDNWREHRLILQDRSVPAMPQYVVSQDYMLWYRMRSHLFIRHLEVAEAVGDFHEYKGMTDAQKWQTIYSMYVSIYDAPVEDLINRWRRFHIEAEPIFFPEGRRGRGTTAYTGNIGGGTSEDPSLRRARRDV